MEKIISIAQIAGITKQLKAKGYKLVLAGGCFDILHIGHIAFLEKAKKSGDILILLLESDRAIKALKGRKRPINNQKNRAKVLSSIEFVDFIVILPKLLNTNDYHNLVKKLSPDVIAVTAGDPNIMEKKSQAKAVRGVVKIVLKKIPEHSTTKLIDFL